MALYTGRSGENQCYMEEHNNTENLTPDEAVEKAKAEAESRR